MVSERGFVVLKNSIGKSGKCKKRRLRPNATLVGRVLGLGPWNYLFVAKRNPTPSY